MKIASRAKSVDGQVQESQVVVLSFSTLEPHFSFPLSVAAKRIGVCTTALKR